MPLIPAFTSLNPRFADLFKHPFCNVVSVVLLDEIKEHVMHRCLQIVFLPQCSQMRDDFPTFSSLYFVPSRCALR